MKGTNGSHRDHRDHSFIILEYKLHSMLSKNQKNPHSFYTLRSAYALAEDFLSKQLLEAA